ncbi:MAG: C4-dicarboxylate ABC transporter, partial [Tabrizicola sp.]
AIKTGQIYQGAIPFILIQVLMIFVVVLFPQTVMHYKGPVVDPTTIEIKVPGLQPMAPGGQGSAPVAPGGLPGLPGAPTLGAPNLGGATTPAPQGAAPAPGALPRLGAPVITP